MCLVPDPIDFCIAQDMVALRADPKIVYNKYLLAVLRSFQIQEQILSTSVGDVIPHFKKSFFRSNNDSDTEYGIFKSQSVIFITQYPRKRS